MWSAFYVTVGVTIASTVPIKRKVPRRVEILAEVAAEKGSAGRGQQVAKITEGASEPKEQPAVETVDDRITPMEQELTELKAMKSQRTYKEGSGKV